MSARPDEPYGVDFLRGSDGDGEPPHTPDIDGTWPFPSFDTAIRFARSILAVTDPALDVYADVVSERRDSHDEPALKVRVERDGSASRVLDHSEQEPSPPWLSGIGVQP